MQGTAGNLSNDREFELSRIIKKSEMFGHFHSDNGIARSDSFDSAFWRIYENLCTWNEENMFYKSFTIMSFTTNRLKQTQNKKDSGDSHVFNY